MGAIDIDWVVLIVMTRFGMDMTDQDLRKTLVGNMESGFGHGNEEAILAILGLSKSVDEFISFLEVGEITRAVIDYNQEQPIGIEQ